MYWHVGVFLSYATLAHAACFYVCMRACMHACMDACRHTHLCRSGRPLPSRAPTTSEKQSRLLRSRGGRGESHEPCPQSLCTRVPPPPAAYANRGHSRLAQEGGSQVVMSAVPAENEIMINKHNNTYIKTMHTYTQTYNTIITAKTTKKYLVGDL